MTDRYEPNAAARRIAFFISPHGFGHAARAASVMEALAEIESSIQFDIYNPFLLKPPVIFKPNPSANLKELILRPARPVEKLKPHRGRSDRGWDCRTVVRSS